VCANVFVCVRRGDWVDRRPDVLVTSMSYRPPVPPPRIDPDTLPEAPHALLLAFFLDRLPVRSPSCASCRERVREETIVRVQAHPRGKKDAHKRCRARKDMRAMHA
jgi:hypothetical protein